MAMAVAFMYANIAAAQGAKVGVKSKIKACPRTK